MSEDSKRKLPTQPGREKSSTKADLWKLALKQKDQDKSAQAESRTMLVVGAAQSGKSSLILRFLDRASEQPKPTIALEYTFGRRGRGHELAKDIAHIWELGGGTALKDLIDMPISVFTVKSLSIVVVVDLAKPETIWLTLDSFFTALHTRLKKVLGDLESKDSKIPAYLRKKAQVKYGDDHPDAALLQLLPVPVTIVGNKYDVYRDFDSNLRKNVNKCLRFLAHTHGASVLYTNQQDESLLNRCRAMWAHHVFKIPYTSKTASFDHNKPLIISAGADSFGSIGAPPLDAEHAVSARTPQAMWQAVFQQAVPKAPKTDVQAAVDDPAAHQDFKEPSIDAARARKDEELQRFRRHLERKQRETR